MFEFIDQYCERIDASFFSEPLGLLSNLAFFPAAFAILRLRHAALSVRQQKILKIFAGLAFAIGIGSSVFHAQPNTLTMIADITPIAGFALAFLVAYMLLLRSENQSLRLPLLFALVTILTPGLLIKLLGYSDYLAKGEFYLGLGPAMWMLSRWDRHRQRGASLRRAAGIFLLALLARTLDQYLCPWWPMGTHFIWHLLNAWVVYQLAYTLSLDRSQQLA